jgi:mannosyl-oligosaccharide alpha-1,2-mannosidase
MTLEFCRNGWGATAVDGLDTSILMEDADIVNEILDYIPKINFTTTAVANQEISFFETTIRYLGGMLSGEFDHHSPKQSRRVKKY